MKRAFRTLILLGAAATAVAVALRVLASRRAQPEPEIPIWNPPPKPEPSPSVPTAETAPEPAVEVPGPSAEEPAEREAAPPAVETSGPTEPTADAAPEVIAPEPADFATAEPDLSVDDEVIAAAEAERDDFLSRAFDRLATAELEPPVSTPESLEVDAPQPDLEPALPTFETPPELEAPGPAQDPSTDASGARTGARSSTRSVGRAPGARGRRPTRAALAAGTRTAS